MGWTRGRCSSSALAARSDNADAIGDRGKVHRAGAVEEEAGVDAILDAVVVEHATALPTLTWIALHPIKTVF